MLDCKAAHPVSPNECVSSDNAKRRLNRHVVFWAHRLVGIGWFDRLALLLLSFFGLWRRERTKVFATSLVPSAPRRNCGWVWQPGIDQRLKNERDQIQCRSNRHLTCVNRAYWISWMQRVITWKRKKTEVKRGGGGGGE